MRSSSYEPAAEVRTGRITLSIIKEKRRGVHRSSNIGLRDLGGEPQAAPQTAREPTLRAVDVQRVDRVHERYHLVHVDESPEEPPGGSVRGEWANFTRLVLGARGADTG